MQTKRVVLGAACALLAVSSGIVRADDKPVTRARNVKAGDTVRQKATINVNAGGMELEIVQLSKTTAKEIDKKGHIVWIAKMESTTVNGQAQGDAAGSPEQTEIRDKSNK